MFVLQNTEKMEWCNKHTFAIFPEAYSHVTTYGDVPQKMGRFFARNPYKESLTMGLIFKLFRDSHSEPREILKIGVFCSKVTKVGTFFAQIPKHRYFFGENNLLLNMGMV